MTKNGTPEAFAPSIDARWRDAFVMELRLQGASGSTIADALVEIETHCHESGQQATEAFGSPVEYAGALDLPDESRWTLPQLVRIWGPLLLVVGGFWWATWGGVAFLLGRQAEIVAGSLISGVVTVISMVLVFVFGNQVMRFVVDHVAWATVALIATLALIVTSGLPFEGIVLGSVPALVPFIVGVAAILAGIALTVFLKRSGKFLNDPLVRPNVPVGPGS